MTTEEKSLAYEEQNDLLGSKFSLDLILKSSSPFFSNTINVHGETNYLYTE